MLCRMFKGMALAGALCFLNSHAEECKGVALYSNGSNSGQMLETGRTFPEPPEWRANWGNFGAMNAPYIRLSGIKNVQDDWKGLLWFPALPLRVDAGELLLKVRSTQNATFGVWLKGKASESRVYYTNLIAEKTEILEIPLASLGVAGTFEVANIGVGLFNVPQYQYTTLFIDDVEFSCVKNGVSAGSSSSSVTATDSPGDLEYEYSNVDAWSSQRNARLLPTVETEFSAAYSPQLRNALISSTNGDFLVSELEHMKIVNTVHAAEMSPQKSRTTWYDNLYSVVRNRLRENVIANPKQLYFEAEAIAARSDYTVIPLLVADLDYVYRACADADCSTSKNVNAYLLTAGLPTSFVRGSKMILVLDPYFFVTKQRDLPSISVCVSGKCNVLSVNGKLELEFPSTGTQKIVVKMKRGERTVEQNLFVEVK